MNVCVAKRNWFLQVCLRPVGGFRRCRYLVIKCHVLRASPGKCLSCSTYNLFPSLVGTLGQGQQFVVFENFLSLGFVSLLRSEVSNLILKGQLGPRVGDVTFLHQGSPALSGTLRKPQNLPGCVLALRSCQAHCGYCRYFTKLVGSALVLAMYSRSSELGFYLFILSMEGGCAPARWVSPIDRSGAL